ncbi:hypothetical protein OCOJLMKI_5172 [Methylobacterium iners]|uniref:Uncharacterized protein n=1 Tax=Methylobacterium iners TaxID=418707 RepID=A0ABQ4S615_9HYPH|nr:hypothetical protein OCOJLMKI_5172 [Methylobacterium iners]
MAVKVVMSDLRAGLYDCGSRAETAGRGSASD